MKHSHKYCHRRNLYHSIISYIYFYPTPPLLRTVYCPRILQDLYEPCERPNDLLPNTCGGGLLLEGKAMGYGSRLAFT